MVLIQVQIYNLFKSLFSCWVAEADHLPLFSISESFLSNFVFKLLNLSCSTDVLLNINILTSASCLYSSATISNLTSEQVSRTPCKPSLTLLLLS